MEAHSYKNREYAGIGGSGDIVFQGSKEGVEVGRGGWGGACCGSLASCHEREQECFRFHFNSSFNFSMRGRRELDTMTMFLLYGH